LTFGQILSKINSMIKNIGVGIVLLLFALAAFAIFPATNKFTNCFAVASGKIQQAPAPPQVSKETFCKDGQDIILSLGTCIQNAKDQGVFAPTLFRLALLFLDSESVAGTIDKHNQVCPQYPVPQLFAK